MPKVITAQEAVRQYIHNGSTVAFGGFVGAMVPEEIKMAIQEQYPQSAHHYLCGRPGRLQRKRP